MYGELTLRAFAGIVVLLALGFLLPLVLPEYFLYLGNTLMMYAILALGLDLLLGWSGQFAFAHIAFFGIGIYTSALLQMPPRRSVRRRRADRGGARRLRRAC